MKLILDINLAGGPRGAFRELKKALWTLEILLATVEAEKRELESTEAR